MSNNNDFHYSDALIGYIEDLEKTVKGLTQIGANLKKYAKEEREAHATYCGLKHQRLLEMFAEESKEKFKRTIAQREAIYRTDYADERMAWTIADRAFQSERTLLTGAQSKIDGLRTLISLEKAKMNLT